MSKLIDINKEFNTGTINKWEYIDKMYSIHSILFDYAEYIDKTNISSIEIIDNEVLMTFRDSGIRFICSRNDKRLAPLETLNFGNYEQDELSMQLKLIEEDHNVFDIGANYGWYAMHIAKEKPKAHIYSFEPIPNTFNFLNKNVSLNNLTNIITFNFGFSDNEGVFNFYLNPNLSVNASMANVSEDKDICNVECSVKRLDNFVQERKVIVDFIKCDVEGAELLVYKGGINTIKRDCPIIFTEMLRKWSAKFNYHPNDIIYLFKDLGYSCFTTNKDHLLPFNTMNENTVETNFFFLHNEKHYNQIKNFTKQ